MDELNSKTIVCLANSRSKGAKCIAGIEYLNGQIGSWIRPISLPNDESVNLHTAKLQDNKQPELLDIIRVPVKGHYPDLHQTENWLIDHSIQWYRVGKINYEDLKKFLIPNAYLWSNNLSTSDGLFDTVSRKDCKHFYLTTNIFSGVATIQFYSHVAYIQYDK